MLGRGLEDDVPGPEGMREARPACLLSRLCLPRDPASLTQLPGIKVLSEMYLLRVLNKRVLAWS